jgi:hypothetical protein
MTRMMPSAEDDDVEALRQACEAAAEADRADDDPQWEARRLAGTA